MLSWQNCPSRLSISQSEIHIWRVDLDCVNYNAEKHFSLLSSEEVKHCNQFVFLRDRYRYQVTHGMKRIILASYLDCDPQCLCFEAGKYGKPAITSLHNSLNIQFNISHSHNIILMAMTIENTLGIDIEYHLKKISIDNLSEFLFSPMEKQTFLALKSQPEKTEAFFRYWTRKEAYLKAKGIGLIADLSNISVDMHALPTDDWLKVSTLEKVEWKLFTLNVGQFYSASVVATSQQKELFSYDANFLA